MINVHFYLKKKPQFTIDLFNNIFIYTNIYTYYIRLFMKMI